MPVHEKTVEPQIPVLAFDVNEKHSQSRLDEHGVRSELHAVKLHVAVVLPEKENTEKMEKIKSIII
jgi:hypothetical protein